MIHDSLSDHLSLINLVIIMNNWINSSTSGEQLIVIEPMNNFNQYSTCFGEIKQEPTDIVNSESSSSSKQQWKQLANSSSSTSVVNDEYETDCDSPAVIDTTNPFVTTKGSHCDVSHLSERALTRSQARGEYNPYSDVRHIQGFNVD